MVYSSSWQAPTGRDLAIEALMDREPHGDYYRVARVVEEVVPAALNSRPNLVTKAALVEQAFALEEYDIDSVFKYNAAYSSGSAAKQRLQQQNPQQFFDSVSGSHLRPNTAADSTLQNQPGGPPNSVVQDDDDDDDSAAAVVVTQQLLLQQQQQQQLKLKEQQHRSHRQRMKLRRLKQQQQQHTPQSVRQVDAVTRERIWNHQSKVIAEKLASSNGGSTSSKKEVVAGSGTTGTTSTAASSSAAAAIPHLTSQHPLHACTSSPSAELVAVLRQIYEETTPTTANNAEDVTWTQRHPFELRHLLQAVTTHEVFSSNTVQEVKGDVTEQEAAVECLLLNLSKLLFKHQPQHHDKSASWNAALWIAILTLITDLDRSNKSEGRQTATTSATTGPSSSIVGHKGDPKAQQQQQRRSRTTPTVRRDSSEEEPDDPVRPSLQVGSILSLFPVESDSENDDGTDFDDEDDENENNVVDDDAEIVGDRDQQHVDKSVAETSGNTNRHTKASLQLDPALLEYFGQAAVVYEERLELQKARLLARMQTPPPPPPAKEPAPSSSDPVSTSVGVEMTLGASTPNEQQQQPPDSHHPADLSVSSSEEPPPLLLRRRRHPHHRSSRREEEQDNNEEKASGEDEDEDIDDDEDEDEGAAVAAAAGFRMEDRGGAHGRHEEPVPLTPAASEHGGGRIRSAPSTGNSADFATRSLTIEEEQQQEQQQEEELLGAIRADIDAAAAAALAAAAEGDGQLVADESSDLVRLHHLHRRVTGYMDDEEDENAMSQVEEAAAALSAAFEQIISSAVTGEEPADEEGRHEQRRRLDSGESGSDSSSSSGSSSSSSDGEEQEEGDEDRQQEQQHVTVYQNQERLDSGEEHLRPDQDEEEGSSSSSSEGGAALESERDIDTDEDDEAVLRQALAISLAERSTDEEDEAGAATAVETERQPSNESTVRVITTDLSAETTTGDEVFDDTAPTPSHPETPVSDSSQGGLAEEGIEVDDAPLPPLPVPPSNYPFYALKSGSVAIGASEDPDVSPEQKGVSAFLDPSALPRFGTLPTSHVLIHLLRYSVKVLESQDSNNLGVDMFTQSTTTVPGGVGSGLFASPQRRQSDPDNQGRVLDNTSPGSHAKEEVVLQLLIAAFLSLISKRNEAIENLRKACAREQKAIQADDNDKPRNQEGTRGPTTPIVSEIEEDDPAFTLALNYVEDDVPLSSESLENKGMKRKAAAAAHDAAALLKSLRKRTDAWKAQVKMYSYCAVNSLKCIRQFLRSIVRQWLGHETSDDGNAILSVVDCRDFIPRHVAGKLSAALNSLTSISKHSTMLSMVGNNESEAHDVFESLELYKEAMVTWGECVPLIIPSEASRVDTLQSLVSVCSVSGQSASISSFHSVEELSSFPSSESEINVHKLHVLCRRLRVSDLLDGFVSRPIPYFQDDESGDEENSTVEQAIAERLQDDPRRASGIIRFLGAGLKNLVGAKHEARKLYLALCHRCHKRILLMDGLYAITETEVDKASAATPGNKTVQTPDTVRVSASPSSALHFDATKCADSIAILSGFNESASGVNGSSVHQRASKVWGAVLATQHFNPKSGVHRWAVRLDKCERGHVFVGVATAQASMRTYVGGDKYGWGMIGTQALWHDRRKIRGDYGATFRTGSTIVVTLDTDAGTLSFSSWKDSQTSSSFSTDPLIQNLLSPKRQGLIGGTVDDWGIAFEGLPLDSRLYPAVGLYQRDDRVTLLTVDSGGRSFGRDVVGGECYFPRLGSAEETLRSKNEIARVRRFNDLLAWDGIQYAADTIHHVVNALCQSDDDEVQVVSSLLPALASSLCLIPQSVPILSTRFALTLLPHVTRSITELANHKGEGQVANPLFKSGLREGEWIIRATSGGSDLEEYIVNFKSARDEHDVTLGFEGTGVGTTGKSKNGLVAIVGTSSGSSITFVEEWSDDRSDAFNNANHDDASACVIAARMTLDGARFEGTYRNVKFGTIGQIVGMHRRDPSLILKYRLKDVPSKTRSFMRRTAVVGETLLCLAHSHLATLLAEDAAHDLVVFDLPKNHESLKHALTKPFLSISSLSPTDESVESHHEFVSKLYVPPIPCSHVSGISCSSILDNVMTDLTNMVNDGSATQAFDAMETLVAALDSSISARCGGSGSLSVLCPEAYAKSRRSVVSALLHHCSCTQLARECMNTSKAHDDILAIWRGGLAIMEDGSRRAISSPEQSKRSLCLSLCQRYDQVSVFLLKLQRPEDPCVIEETIRDVAWFYGMVDNEVDLTYLRSEMSSATRQGFMRFLAIQEVVGLLSIPTTMKSVALESLLIGLPRVLGRGHVDAVPWKTGVDGGSKHVTLELDGHYLSGLAGCRLEVRRKLQTVVHLLFQTLCEVVTTIISRCEQESENTMRHCDSLILAVLAVFVSNLRGDILSHTKEALSILTKAFSTHRSAVLDDLRELKEGRADLVVKHLQEICQRDISRAVLRSSLAVAHVILYYASHSTDYKGGRGLLEECLSWFCAELSLTFPVIERAAILASTELSKTLGDEEWERWCQQVHPSPRRKKESEGVICNAGVEFLKENGTILNLAPNGNPKHITRHKSSVPTRSTGESLNKLKGGFCHHYVSHWTHILCAVLRTPTPEVIDFMSKDERWLALLLKAIGLDIEFGATCRISKVSARSRHDGFLPARHRARIVFLLIHYLERLEPVDILVDGLFRLAGSELLARNIGDEEGLVSREVVSLLRKLHHPRRVEWRNSVNRVIGSISLDSTFEKKIGMLDFFNGGIKKIDRLSHVLMRPAAAVPLSQDHQSSPGNKTGTAGSATPASVGTDAVVSGLMRFSSDGGIVSSIDAKNGICEVILTSREQSDARNSLVESHGSGGTPPRGRQALTVRALRTPLADIVHAQEVPLYFDDSIPVGNIVVSMFPKAAEGLALSVLLSDTSKSPKNSQELYVTSDEVSRGVTEAARDAAPSVTAGKSGEAKFAYDTAMVNNSLLELTSNVMTLQSCIVLFSDRRFLKSFLDHHLSPSTLPKLLSLAWPERRDIDGNAESVLSTRNESLSSLPLHESKFGHLLLLLKELNFRAEIMQQTPEATWSTRLEAYLAQQKEDRREAGSVAAPVRDQGASPTAATDTLAGSRRGEVSAAPRDVDSHSNRSISQSTGGSNSEEDEEQEAALTAAAHLREAAIAQMAELGIPRSYSELALRRTGGTNIEAAVHFCLENGAEIERMLAEEVERQSSGRPGTRTRSNRDDGHLLRQLLEMGFPRRWCTEALAATGNNVDDALTWILNNNETLENMDTSEEEEGGEEAEEEEESEEDDTEEGDASSERAIDTSAARDASSLNASPDEANDTPTDLVVPEGVSWTGSVTPLRVISGRATINSKTLEISGLPSGGFASVGVKGVLLKSGKWYYEVVLGTAGCIQLGFGDASFAGHCNADRGDGCGDSSSSFSFDGWRRLRWHATATEWGCRWKEGDVIGCLVDLNERVMAFTLNGEGESVGMGVAFTGFNFCGGLFPVVSFNRRERLRLILGGNGEPFRYPPPEGYHGVGEAVTLSVRERDKLLQKESTLNHSSWQDDAKKFLCDFSDEEHGHELFSWSHRYYGSDASVHLGSSRTKQSSPKTTTSSPFDSTPSAHLTRRLEKLWSSSQNKANADSNSHKEIVVLVSDGYEVLRKQISMELFHEAGALCSLLARKLILHIIVTQERFDARLFSNTETELVDLQRFWKVLESCLCLRSWSGEAGAMAIAAEALGLGIQMQARHGQDRAVSTLDESISLPTFGFPQVLSSVLKQDAGFAAVDTGFLFAASAEAAFASDGGGAPLTFLRKGLQSAVIASSLFRSTLVAAVRRSVRLLAVVEDSDPADFPEDDDDAEKNANSHPKKSDANDAQDASQPDARLASFFTGLLLSKPVQVAAGDATEIQEELFEAWSVGLLSASLPWRMICAFTASSILNMNPHVLSKALKYSHTLAQFYGRLHNTVVRRVWAERAAVPVCSRYVQSLIELLCSVKRAVDVCSDLPLEFTKFWGKFDVEASSPRPLKSLLQDPSRNGTYWESDDGWMSSEEVWTGTLVHKEVSWKKPQRSAVRSLMDGGEGPPMLRVGCSVMRGPDWDVDKYGSQDGFDEYEAAKAMRDKEMKEITETTGKGEEELEGAEKTAAHESTDGVETETKKNGEVSKKKKKKKIPSPKLPLGKVVSVEPWNGIPALGRKVQWANGTENIYRYGGDGGKFDIIHVETNHKCTRVVKKHPLPESAEQCAARRGFGVEKCYSALLRIKYANDPKVDDDVEGILELPDFGAGVRVVCRMNVDGSVVVEEKDLLFGSKDSGWEARFGQPSYVPGTRFILHPVARESCAQSSFMSFYEEVKGNYTFEVTNLRNPDNGGKISVEWELRLLRGRRASDGKFHPVPPSPPPISFDRDFHAPSLAISRDGRTVTCVSPDGRGTAFATTGFSKGVHYWEVKLEQADIGSVFIGCAEKPSSESPPRLNRWHGWGFVNFRATYCNGSERVYGVHAHASDTIGVLLDCDAGRLSFFYDGLKYGEHILNDLGCAFENLSPFGFSVEGCGTGGAGQSAPSGFPRSPAQGFVRPRTLWPVIGLRNHGDRVTISPKWSTNYGVDGVVSVRNILAVDEILDKYTKNEPLPSWFVEECFAEYKRWSGNAWSQTITRGSGPYRLNLDTSHYGCAAASAALGLKQALLAGDRIRLSRSSGRVLELAEEALILGQHQLRLYYKVVAQKNEGQSLTEGASLPHCFEECDLVDEIEFVNPSKGLGVSLPTLDRFKCLSEGGLKIVYSGGAVVRSDLEINDQSRNLATIPVDTIIAAKDVIERRVNSCGVVRYKVRHGDVEGYISATIRGGNEEPIVQYVDGDMAGESFPTPLYCADQWFREWKQHASREALDLSQFDVGAVDEFAMLLSKAVISGVSMAQSDSILAGALSSISNFTDGGDAVESRFAEVVSALSYALHAAGAESKVVLESENAAANQAAATIFCSLPSHLKLPDLQSVLARVALIRAFNRRARFALPWLSVRPCQEGSAILGGVCGYGSSTDKAGRSRIHKDSRDFWVEAPSLASRIRSLRGLFLSSIKRGLLQSITLATMTPTPLSHDEYELPREIRTVRINRLKAARAMSSEDMSAKRKYSVFAQLHNETKNWGGAALRRGYVAKGHGGQKRAFKVKFVGEGVNDYSGPYREVFTDAFGELLKFDSFGRGFLGVLDPTPNNVAEIGENRDLFMFSLNGQEVINPNDDLPTDQIDAEEVRVRECFSSVLAVRDEASREVEEALVFLGRITATAYRHGIPVDLSLPLQSIWKSITEETNVSDPERLQELDVLAFRQQQPDQTTVPSLLWWQQRMLNSFLEGLSHVMPVEILSLLSGEELRDAICGNSDVEVELLKRVVEYEGYEETDKVIEFFWDTLREITNDERKNFLQFVWARSRLPMRESDFDAPFKIQKDSVNVFDKADRALPSASTCFFSLTLPEYSSKDILKEKLLFAIKNVTTMETDFQTNSAEIAEGYRAF